MNSLPDREGQVHLCSLTEDFRITGLSGNECPTSRKIGFFVDLTARIVMSELGVTLLC